MKRRWAHLVAILLADKKRASMLAILLGLLGIAGLRAVVLLGPSSARASDRAENRRDGPGSANASPQGSESGRSRRGPGIRVAAPPPLERDLFALNEVYFPPPSQTQPPVHPPPKSEASSVETPPQASGAERADEPGQRAQRDAQRLRLRGTLLGSAPMAVIEVIGSKDRRGTVVRPGQEVEGFVVSEIRAAAVVLERDGVKVELKRALPEG